ncbi:MAG: hypothetical protein LBE62_08415 [Azonexus sp.]|jgi:phenylacetate-CoA ligase|nr:hypothetical protein [Azonexus sp.]
MMKRQAFLRSETRYLEAVETMPRAQLLVLQEQRLLKMLSYAYERAPLVRRLWNASGITPADIGSRADFIARAPFLTKEDIRRQRDEEKDAHAGLLCLDPSEVNWLVSTTGTTGEPTILSHHWGNTGLDQQAPGLNGQWPPSYAGSSPRDYWEMGVREGDYFLNFGFRIRGSTFRPAQYLGAIPIFLSYAPGDLLLAMKLSLQYRPTMWWVMTPPTVRALLALERDHKIDMHDVFSSYKAVIFAGEPLGPQMRTHLERWGVGDRIFNMSALGDIALAQDCRAHDGCHAWEDVALVELIDPETGAVIEKDGRGELVVTTLVNNADALIRFRTGDYVDMKWGTCACGRTHARFQPLGRTGDEILIGDRSVLPIDVWLLIEQQPECADGIFQMIRPQREMQYLHIRVGYAGQSNLADLQARLTTSIQAALGLPVNIELVPQERILATGGHLKFSRTVKE